MHSASNTGLTWSPCRFAAECCGCSAVHGMLSVTILCCAVLCYAMPCHLMPHLMQSKFLISHYVTECQGQAFELSVLVSALR